MASENCYICDTKFSGKIQLYRHMLKLHAGDGKNHKCLSCSKIFHTAQHLQAHMVIHRKKSSQKVMSKNKKEKRKSSKNPKLALPHPDKSSLSKIHKMALPHSDKSKASKIPKLALPHTDKCKPSKIPKLALPHSSNQMSTSPLDHSNQKRSTYPSWIHPQQQPSYQHKIHPGKQSMNIHSTRYPLFNNSVSDAPLASDVTPPPTLPIKSYTPTMSTTETETDNGVYREQTIACVNSLITRQEKSIPLTTSRYSSSVKRKHHDINVDDRVHPAKRTKSEYVCVSQEDKSSDLLDLMSSIEENPDDSYNMLLEFIKKNYQ